MKTLYVEDLKDLNEDDIKGHIATDYEYDRNELDKYKFIIAYESVGSWGCDSSSFFLFKEKKSGTLFEVHGSHCSCYGFEGQFEPEETSLVALKDRAEKGSVFSCGGYDNNPTDNEQQIKEFVLGMKS
jgi:hypothetical protein